MFHDSDYTTFMANWVAYHANFIADPQQKIKITELKKQECAQIFGLIKNYAPCTISQFERQIKRNIAFGITPEQTNLREIMELASFDGYTKEQAKSHVARLWRDLLSNLDVSLDYCFSDLRFCIGFYLAFGAMKDFRNIKITHDNENVIFKRLIDNYLSCSINENTDILKVFSIQTGWQKSKIRRVVIIGNEIDAKNLCDRFYGAGNWCKWRNDLYNQYYETHFEAIDYQMDKTPDEKDIERIKLMEEVIAELQKQEDRLVLALQTK